MSGCGPIGDGGNRSGNHSSWLTRRVGRCGWSYGWRGGGASGPRWGTGDDELAWLIRGVARKESPKLGTFVRLELDQVLGRRDGVGAVRERLRRVIVSDFEKARRGRVIVSLREDVIEDALRHFGVCAAAADHELLSSGEKRQAKRAKGALIVRKLHKSNFDAARDASALHHL